MFWVHVRRAWIKPWFFFEGTALRRISEIIIGSYPISAWTEGHRLVPDDEELQWTVAPWEEAGKPLVQPWRSGSPPHPTWSPKTKPIALLTTTWPGQESEQRSCPLPQPKHLAKLYRSHQSVLDPLRRRSINAWILEIQRENNQQILIPNMAWPAVYVEAFGESDDHTQKGFWRNFLSQITEFWESKQPFIEQKNANNRKQPLVEICTKCREFLYVTSEQPQNKLNSSWANNSIESIITFNIQVPFWMYMVRIDNRMGYFIRGFRFQIWKMSFWCVFLELKSTQKYVSKKSRV